MNNSALHHNLRFSLISIYGNHAIRELIVLITFVFSSMFADLMALEFMALENHK